jgi:hypothetical protein
VVRRKKGCLSHLPSNAMLVLLELDINIEEAHHPQMDPAA